MLIEVRQIPYVFSYIESKQVKQMKKYNKTEIDSQIENKLVVTTGGVGVRPDRGKGLRGTAY